MKSLRNFTFLNLYIGRFYTNYSNRDIVTYRRDFALKQIEAFEELLSELEKK